MLFPITLASGKVVYMQGKESSTYRIIMVSAVRLLGVWDVRQMNDRSELDWYMRKYRSAEACFAQSEHYPVAPAEIGGYFDYILGNPKCIRLDEGITRTQWLLDHGAQSFPMKVAAEEADNLIAVVGVISP